MNLLENRAENPEFGSNRSEMHAGRNFTVTTNAPDVSQMAQIFLKVKIQLLLT